MKTDSNDPDGGNAFPSPPTNEIEHPGMALRDYFAAKAMAAELNMWHHPTTDVEINFESIAERAYKMADAMLDQREA